MDYQFLFDDDEVFGRIPSLLSSHLDSPLRTHQIEYVKNNLSKILTWNHTPKHLNRGQQFICEDVKTIHNVLGCHHFDIMSSANFTDIRNITIPGSHAKHAIKMFSKCLSTSLRNFELQTNRLLDGHQETSDIQKNLKLLLQNQDSMFRHIPAIILNHFYWFYILYQAVIVTGMTEKEPGVAKDLKNMNLLWEPVINNPNMWFLEISNTKMIASRNCFFTILPDGRRLLGTREHLLLLNDLFIQRFNLLLSGFLAHRVGFSHYLTHQELNRLFIWGDIVMSIYGELAFDILSKWEPLCLGVIMSNSGDPICDNDRFLTTIVQDILDDFNHLAFDLKQHICILIQTLESLFSQSKHKLSQAFGLFRLWGHPNIDPREGLTKLKQIACQPRMKNPKKVRDVSCVFMEQFCLNYRMKKGMWPAMNVDQLPIHNVIRRAYETNSCLSTVSKYYNRSDWMRVKLAKTFEITDKLNLSELISDKAMSLGLEELYLQIRDHKNIGLATDKAVIIQWLKSNLVDPIAFLSKIDKYGFDKNEIIFGVCPKERELKIIARFFGLATLVKRMYIVLTEAMIAEYIIPYFPQITMMDDAITLSKKFFDKTRDMTNQATYFNKRSVNVVTNIDFKKWNTYMREEETHKIFEEMDHLFGFERCISRTHEMFNSSYMYLADGSYLPKIKINNNILEMEKDDYVWTGHLGGIEGLRQKGWTIFTVCVLIHVMEPFHQKFSLMGQGDNQVLIIHYATSLTASQIKALQDKIIDHMESVLKLIGPPLKREETWSSSNLFVYGKAIFLNGCPLSMSQKKICRMFPMSNEGFPTIETAISSISANCSAACASDFNPFLTFIMYGFWTSIVFDNLFDFSYLGYSVSDITDPLCKNHVSLSIDNQIIKRYFLIPDSIKKHIKIKSKEILLILNIFPKLLGGYPVCFLNNFLIKNFPDPLTEFITIMKSIYPNLDSEERKMIDILLTIEFDSIVSPQALFSNPTGLNLILPSTPGNVVKSSVTNFLKGADWIQNEYVKEYLNLNEYKQDELYNALLTMTPLNPLVAHSILEATLIGRAQQVVGQLDKTGTLIKISAKHGDNLLKRVRDSEKNYFSHFLMLLSVKRPIRISLQQCSRITAQSLREQSWQNSHITGVTVPYPVETFALEPNANCANHTNISLGYFLIKQTRVFDIKNWWKGEIIGDAIPYFGSKTKDKVKNYGKQLARNSAPLLRQTLNLHSLIGWATDHDSELSKCLRAMLHSITDLPSEIIMPADSEISGSLEHRFITTSIERGGKVEMMFNFTTYMIMSTDTLIAYAKGTKNVNLHFQACLSYFASLFSVYRSLNSDTMIECYHGHQICLDCICEINEQKLELEKHDWSKMLLSRPLSKFCYINKDNLQLKSIIYATSYKTLTKEDPLLLNDNWRQYRASRAAAREIMIKLRNISMEIGDGKDTTSNTWVFPVAWVFKLNPYIFIICFYVELFNFFIFRQFEDCMYDITFLKLSRLFQKFLIQIDDGFFGLFSSWLQNPNFLDFVTGLPFAVKPPLSPNVSRRSCGSLFKRFLLSIHMMIQDHKINLEDFPHWNKIIISGDESIDSHPVLFLLIMSHIVAANEISISSNPMIYLSLKRNLPALKNDSEFLRAPLSEDILMNIDLFRNYLDHEEIMSLIRFLKGVNIMYAQESADGLISQLEPSSIMSTIDQPKPINVHDLVFSSCNITIPETEKLSLERSISMKESQLVLDVETTLESHRLKPVSFPTTAAYKLLSIIKDIGIAHFDVPVVGCFGDGAGGFSKIITLISKAKVFYNSLMIPSQMFTNAIGNGYPPCFAGYPSLRKRLIHLRYTYEGISDLTHPHFASELIKNVDFKCKIIICDAEGGGWESGEKAIKMLFNLLQISEHHDSQILIFKTYFQNWISFVTQLNMAMDYFRQVSIIRTKFSTKNSSEVYIVAKGIKRTISTCRIEEATKIHVSSYLSKSYLSQLLLQLKQVVVKLPTPDMSSSYSRALRKSECNIQDRLTLLMISPSLERALMDDRFIFKMPYSFLLDVFSNTHLVKFNNKYSKITKLNFISKKFLQKTMIGWLVIMCANPLFRIQDFDNLITNGCMVFYPIKKHFWSLWVAKKTKLFGLKYTYMNFEKLISTSIKKEILTKSSQLRLLLINRLDYDLSISSFPRLYLIKNNGLTCFHEGFRPMQFSSDHYINKNVLGINYDENDKLFLQRVDYLQQLELKGLSYLKKEKDWISSD